MVTIKSFTSPEQSRKLAEILPIESADGGWYETNNPLAARTNYWLYTKYTEKAALPAWSLAALLGVLPKIINNETLFIETSAVLWHIGYRNIYTARADNPVDACVAMIEKLHELKML